MEINASAMASQVQSGFLFLVEMVRLIPRGTGSDNAAPEKARLQYASGGCRASVRPCGAGHVFVALADDIAAILVNPALEMLHAPIHRLRDRKRRDPLPGK